MVRCVRTNHQIDVATISHSFFELVTKPRWTTGYSVSDGLQIHLSETHLLLYRHTYLHQLWIAFTFTNVEKIFCLFWFHLNSNAGEMSPVMGFFEKCLLSTNPGERSDPPSRCSSPTPSSMEVIWQ